MSFYELPDRVPAEFKNAAAGLDSPLLRAELVSEQIHSPEGISKDSLAFATEAPNKASETKNRGVGRLVFIYDKKQSETWGGNMRIIAYGKSPMKESERGVQEDDSHWYWGMLIRALINHGAKFINEAGTVTTIKSKGMGSIAEDTTSTEIEIRASWTPVDGDFGPHFAAWQDLIAGMAGFNPDGEVVVELRKAQ